MSSLKKYLIVFGIAIIAFGFLYDVFFGGVPPQDPPKDIMEKYNQNVFISDVIIKFGLFVMIIGIILKLIPSSKKNS